MNLEICKKIWSLSKDPTILASLKGEILETNASFCKLLDLSEENIIRSNFNDLSSSISPELPSKFQTFCSTSNLLSSTLEIKSIDQKYFEIDLEKFTNQEVTFVLLKFKDITKYKKPTQELISLQKEIESSNRLKSSFLANMSHEIRTPLNGILGMASIIEQEYPGDKTLSRYTNLIQESGKRLLQTINNILEFSKADAQETIMKKSIFELNDLIYNLVQLFEPMAKNKGLDLKINLSKKEIWLENDQNLLEQILTNLVSNAIKYTPEGVIEIKIEQKNGLASILVKDTGIGISESFLEKIFQPFTQESAGKNRQFEGNGLGLSIVKKFIDLMGGEIEAESEKGRGSQFKVRFPVYSKTSVFNHE